MNQKKKIFTYKNKIILTNGASLQITSSKYIKNYQLNFKILKKNKILLNNDSKNKLNFFKNIF
uniref:Ymf101 n=1 Tax=Hyaloperonospora arabidopsidis TaxID=272952 RepID=UPI0020298F44|nr:Ymf101 [Hyaloperonospora arabidopsidis]DAZ88020.1 TPA_asm: Ymf101 [Hyaloperonospora arabidopsidis]